MLKKGVEGDKRGGRWWEKRTGGKGESRLLGKCLEEGEYIKRSMLVQEFSEGEKRRQDEDAGKGVRGRGKEETRRGGMLII